MEEKKPFPKMKFAGYACLVFAAALTALAVFGLAVEIPATKELVGTWLLTGTGLLGMNAGKRIGGAAVMNRTGGEK